MSIDISFIYRLNDEPTVYFAKYCSDYISDEDHVDRELYKITKEIINLQKKKDGEPELFQLSVGVIGVSKPIHWSTSTDERRVFDLYIDFTDTKNNYYIYKGVQYPYVKETYDDSDDDEDEGDDEEDEGEDDSGGVTGFWNNIFSNRRY